jgi:nitroreductase
MELAADAGVRRRGREDDARLRPVLRIPEELRIVAGVTLGHGAPDPEWSERTSRATRRRRALDELVHWNRW